MTAYQGTVGFLSCQLRDLIQQPFGYWPNALTTRLPDTLIYQVAYILFTLHNGQMAPHCGSLYLF
jgi:hypothetical protein